MFLLDAFRGASKKYLVFNFLLVLPLLTCSGQSQSKSPEKNSTKLGKQLISFISQTEDTLLHAKSENPYLAYEGKIIRKISFEQIGFERNVIDTSKHFLSAITKTANRLHHNSKTWVIRDNLFIHEGDALNPLRLADNERYLRDLNFVLDCRIYVKLIRHSKDSVDLLVVTRDVFSLGVFFEPNSPSKYTIKLDETNLAGMGQHVQVGMLFDAARSPLTGFELLYQKINVMGSFINASIDYSQIGSASAYGSENQRSFTFQLDRLLFMGSALKVGE